MTNRALLLALVATASALVAAVSFGLSEWLDVFAPCRVPYLTRQSVKGSLACQSFYAVNLFSLLVLAAAAIAALCAIVLFIKGHWTDRR